MSQPAEERSFLHKDTLPGERARFPSLVGMRAFRTMWLAVAGLLGALALLGTMVAAQLD